MNRTKLTRRIDGLGRIVIPKEIRDNMNVADGDLLEISVVNNEIVLSKYSKLDDKIGFIKNIASIVANNFECKIIITDRTKIIYSNFLEEYEDKVISKSLRDHINNRSNMKISNVEIFEKYVLEGDYNLMAIIKDSDSLGISLILTNDYDLSQKINSVLTSLII